MNNQLKLPWVQTYRETPAISRPAFIEAILGTIQRIERQLRRNGQVHPQTELGRGYAEFVARRHSCR